VDDELTSTLMEHFYAHLGKGMTEAAALRHAQHWFLLIEGSKLVVGLVVSGLVWRRATRRRYVHLRQLYKEDVMNNGKGGQTDRRLDRRFSPTTDHFLGSPR
jgi:CHAT domain-containing protein